MKKLFTLLALLTCFLGAKAATKTVVDAEVNFSDYTDISQVKWAGWGASESARARLSIVDGCLHFESTEATDPTWDCQFHPIGGVSSVEEGVVYTLHFKVKGDHAENISALGFGITPYGQFPITEEWVEGTFDYEAAAGGGGDILFQCGGFVGSFDIAYLKITHEQDDTVVPQTWLQMITNDGQALDEEGHTNKYVGDAEFGAWPAWALELTDGINANWRTDRAKEICAWALTMGDNYDNGFDGTFHGEKPDRSRPYPATIAVDPGDPNNHVFMADVHTISCIDDCDAAENPGASTAWSNQFWIMSPQTWKAGTKIHLKFKYKAEHACSVGTQFHTQWPSKYLFWNAVGDVAFTTDWQEFDKTIELSADQAGSGEEACASLAFNLCSDATDGRTPNKFYFDDLSWEVLKLDHGFFVAGQGASVAYDYSQAIQFVYDEDDESWSATIGKKGDEDSWVNEVQISTVRGDNSAFKGATLKPTKAIVLDADGVSDWLDYGESSNAKIKLPAAGVYTIYIAPGDHQMQFEQVEGDVPVVKEPVAIATNTTEFVVNATERDWKPAKDDGTPQDGEEGVGTGQSWDNQFWIAANRDLAKGEATVLKFKYKSSIDAKVSTQAHKVGDDGKPCTYLNWQGINISSFAAGDWVEFSQDFTIPDGDDGMRSIVFNLSEIKGACDYFIKDVQWYLYDADLEEGKTYENLINADGTENFWIKVDKGVPYQYGTDPSGISTVSSKKNIGSAVIYNLAGQRVSNGFKGIVVKDGKKYVK